MTRTAFGEVPTTDTIDPVAGAQYDAIVAADGSADYTTLGAALTAGAMSIYVRNGTYAETGDLSIPSNARIIGESEAGVLIDFGASAFSFGADGNGGVVEDTGTIQATNGSTQIDGTGTSFTNLSPDDWLIIEGAPYRIDSITSDTVLDVAIAYQGVTLTTPISNWFGQSMVRDIIVENIEVMNTTGEAFNFRAVLDLHVRRCHAHMSGTLATNPAVLVERCVKGFFGDFSAHHGPGDGVILLDSKGITIQGSATHTNAGTALTIDGVSEDISLVSDSISQSAAGIVVSGTATQVNITGCCVVLHAGKGIDVQIGTGSVSITTSHIVGNGGAGIDFDGTFCVASGCIIVGNTGPGILGGIQCLITHCHIHDNTTFGIDLSADTGCTVTGCHIQNNGSDGIFIDGVSFPSSDCVISGNVLQDNGGAGINCGGDDCILTSNRVFGNTGDGIVIQATALDTVAIGNNTKGNTGTNFNDLGTGTITTGNKTA